MHHPAWKIAGLAALVLLGACQRTTTSPAAGTPTEKPVGGDRDAHGCLPAAGYSWCEKAGDCVRPWELAQDKGLPPGPAAFDQYCGNPPARP